MEHVLSMILFPPLEEIGTTMIFRVVVLKRNVYTPENNVGSAQVQVVHDLN